MSLSDNRDRLDDHWHIGGLFSQSDRDKASTMRMKLKFYGPVQNGI
ncbi:MAG: hypothetical protein ABF459_17130 [Gluconobacter cerinus]